MSGWEILRGNSSTQEILIKDKDNAIVTNLDAAESITFKVKEKKTDTTAKITKTVGEGIEVDTPSEGYLRITILPSDTENLEPDLYFCGLEIKWSDVLIYEILLSFDGRPTEQFWVKQDTVN